MPLVAMYMSELVWCSLWLKYNPHNVTSLTNYRLLPDQKGCHNFRFISGETSCYVVICCACHSHGYSISLRNSALSFFLKIQSIPFCDLFSDVNRKILGQYLHGCLAFKHCMQLHSKVTIVAFKKSVIKNL